MPENQAAYDVGPTVGHSKSYGRVSWGLKTDKKDLLYSWNRAKKSFTRVSLSHGTTMSYCYGHFMTLSVYVDKHLLLVDPVSSLHSKNLLTDVVRCSNGVLL